MRPRFTNLIIAVLIAGIAVGVAFGGGILYGRNTAPTPKAANAAPAPAAAGGGAAAAGGGAAAAGGGAGAGGGFGGGARAAGTPGAGGRGGAGGAGGFGGVVGAISKVAGNTIDVTTAQGTTVPVQIAPDTRILTSTEGSVSDLRPGLIVTVVGQADATGTVPATAIQIQPIGPGQPNPGATPAPGARQGGGQGGRGGQGARPTPTPTP